MKKFIDECETIVPELITAFNALESFSIFFTSGVAAEQVAFSSVGQTFTNNVQELLPLLMLLSKDRYYRNIVKLFLLWHGRIESMRLLQDRASIENSLKKIENKTINPLGT